MRSEHDQQQMDSMRRRIKQDKETGYVPTLRGLDLKRFPSHVSAISESTLGSEHKITKDK